MGEAKRQSDAKRAEKARLDAAHAAVGALIVACTSLDHLLTNVTIEAFGLIRTPFLEPIVATMDARQKIELLKRRAKRISQKDWKKGIIQFCEGLEKVYKLRNIVAHDPMVLNEGAYVFRPYAAAKMIRDLNIDEGRIEHTPLSACDTAIMLAEETLNLGLNLLDNLKRYSAEYQRRWRDKDRN